MKNETMTIAYVGKKPFKTFKGFRFERMGTATLPKEVAAEALKYPTVFVQSDKLEDIQAQLATDLVAPEKSALQLMESAIAAAIAEGVTDDALALAIESLANVGNIEPEPEPEPEGIDTARLEAISTAILALNQEDTENDYTLGGKPRVSAVERVLGYDVTADEVNAAYSALGGE